jgi:predicted enzyme related to lactoylglutathione lyase
LDAARTKTLTNQARPTSEVFRMVLGISLILYPVKDIEKAKAMFTKVLGVAPYADAPYYVGFKVGDQEVGLVPSAKNSGMTGPLGYWEVDDIKKVMQSFLDAGGQTKQAVRDVGGGKLVASVVDADGNPIGLAQSP